ncbi:phosphoadenylyl-sulfate reductase [Sphingomonas jaspsi]|uniref:phosphoadenylyl-sulfate reductase n=1 Tax=Sphingomonas jaspsi TaxID=392409 RepID=UPI0004B305E3|nr:phosphoadenylyl-sulfate reductase [Sphingomonas jaspsi]
MTAIFATDVTPAIPVLVGERLAYLNKIEPSPIDRLRAMRETIPGRLIFTAGFGMEGQALFHMICEAGLDVEFVTIDTGRLFPETYELWAKTEERYGIRFRSLHPEPADLADLNNRFGANGFQWSKSARLACCHARKVAPLEKALAGAEGWITGLRADQSHARRSARFAEWDAHRDLIKAAPLFDWTRREVEDFCAANDVPINALHAQGFASIGCEPCTRAIQPGEEERAGRWWWEADSKRECGLHVVRREPAAAGDR